MAGMSPPRRSTLDVAEMRRLHRCNSAGAPPRARNPAALRRRSSADLLASVRTPPMTPIPETGVLRRHNSEDLLPRLSPPSVREGENKLHGMRRSNQRSYSFTLKMIAGAVSLLVIMWSASSVTAEGGRDGALSGFSPENDPSPRPPTLRAGSPWQDAQEGEHDDTDHDYDYDYSSRRSNP